MSLLKDWEVKKKSPLWFWLAWVQLSHHTNPLGETHQADVDGETDHTGQKNTIILEHRWIPLRAVARQRVLWAPQSVTPEPGAEFGTFPKTIAPEGNCLGGCSPLSGHFQRGNASASVAIIFLHKLHVIIHRTALALSLSQFTRSVFKSPHKDVMKG